MSLEIVLLARVEPDKRSDIYWLVFSDERIKKTLLPILTVVANLPNSLYRVMNVNGFPLRNYWLNF